MEEYKIDETLEPIIFKDEGGYFSAQVGKIIIRFNNPRFCIISELMEDGGAPCEYTGEFCPEDKERTSNDCPLVDDCPYIIIDEIEGKSEAFDSPDLESLQKKARWSLLSPVTYFGDPQDWRQPDATTFGKSPWIFEKPWSDL